MTPRHHADRLASPSASTRKCKIKWELRLHVAIILHDAALASRSVVWHFASCRHSHCRCKWRFGQRPAPGESNEAWREVSALFLVGKVCKTPSQESIDMHVDRPEADWDKTAWSIEFSNSPRLSLCTAPFTAVGTETTKWVKTNQP